MRCRGGVVWYVSLDPALSDVTTSPSLIGWVDKAVLLPLVKAVFSYRLKESEIKAFLSSPSLKAMVNSTHHARSRHTSA